MPLRGAYLGTPGDMFMFAHVRGSLSSTTTRATNYQTTLGGQLRAQVSPVALREWQCQLPLSEPGEVARFKGLVMGLYGLGPFAWVPVDASVTNVLTPAASMPGPKYATWSGAGVPAGVWVIPGLGTVRHSVLATGMVLTLGQNTPVVPGLPVTGSVYIAGAGDVSVWMRTVDATGATMDNVKTVVSATQVPTRVVVSVPVVSSAAVSGHVIVSGASQVALPAVSWTPSAAPWAPGGGSNAVFVDAFDTDLQQLNPRTCLYENVSFTVKELASDA